MSTTLNRLPGLSRRQSDTAVAALAELLAALPPGTRVIGDVAKALWLHSLGARVILSQPRLELAVPAPFSALFDGSCTLPPQYLVTQRHTGSDPHIMLERRLIEVRLSELPVVEAPDVAELAQGIKLPVEPLAEYFVHLLQRALELENGQTVSARTLNLLRVIMDVLNSPPYRKSPIRLEFQTVWLARTGLAPAKTFAEAYIRVVAAGEANSHLVTRHRHPSPWRQLFGRRCSQCDHTPDALPLAPPRLVVHARLASRVNDCFGATNRVSR